MGCFQRDVSTLNAGGGSQAQTEGPGGGRAGDDRHHKEPRGAETGRSCQGGENRSQEAGKEEDGKGPRTDRGANCRSVGVGGWGAGTIVDLYQATRVRLMRTSSARTCYPAKSWP